MAELQVLAKSHPFEHNTSPLSSLTHRENAAAAVIMCTRENRNVSLKNLSPVLQKRSLKTMKRRKPLARGNCRVHDFRVLTRIFASLCNILLIQSFNLKIACVFPPLPGNYHDRTNLAALHAHNFQEKLCMWKVCRIRSEKEIDVPLR